MFVPYIIEDLEFASSISVLISLSAALIVLSVDYIKFMLRKDSPFREDVLDDQGDQDDVNDYILSPQFQKDLNERVTKDTWEFPTKDGKGLPKIYLDEKGDLVRHWKDGTIEIIEEYLLDNE